MLVLKRNSPHWGCNQIPPSFPVGSRPDNVLLLWSWDWLMVYLSHGVFLMSEGDGGCGNDDPICHCITQRKAFCNCPPPPHPTKQLPATYWSMQRASQAPLSGTISPQLYKSLIEKNRFGSHSGQMRVCL